MDGSTIELVITGKNFYSDFKMPLWYQANENFDPDFGYKSRFKLILIEEGTGIIRLDDLRSAFIAPAVFCLNETERPFLEKSLDIKARALFFHPALINSIYSFENIRNASSFSTTECQDRYWLLPFIDRGTKYKRQLNIGPATAKRIAQLFDMINLESTSQKTEFWPCRTRSFFLELLFLISQIQTTPEMTCEITIPQQSFDIDPIILYLHENYQKKITLSELTKIFHINRTTLSQRFLEVTGITVISYLTALRIRLASIILRDTTLPICEVMNRVGFQDNTHFGRVFRKSTGFSPTEYREKFCWMLH